MLGSRAARLLAVTAMIGAAAGLAGCATAAGTDSDAAPSEPVAAAVASPATPAADESAVAVPAPRIPTTDLRPAPIGARSVAVAASAPVRVGVASVGIDSSLVTLGLTPDGAVAPPEDPDTAGWFTGSTQPGQVGPAVIAAHVDSSTGPAAFYRLADVTVGDDVTVDRQDGSTVTFRVTAVEQYPKDGFPTDAVYGPTPGPVLRLVTCGGTFDQASGHYRDNIVVYAVLA